MRNKERSRIKTGGLIALVLFVLFAVCILSVLFTGAGVYRRLTKRGLDTYERRTAAQYLTTKVRQADAEGCLSASQFEGLDALVITETLEGTEYHTWIYCYDGYIRELFAEADSRLMPEAGEKILEAEAFRVRMEDSLIKAEITGTDGNSQELVLYPRSGREVGR